MEMTIFSIDGWDDVHWCAKFLRYLDTLRATQKLVGDVDMCIGGYEDEMELSFCMLTVDYENYIARGPYSYALEGQQSILRVPSDVRQPVVLEYLNSGDRESLGTRRYDLIEDQEGFTFFPRLGVFMRTQW